MRAYLRDIRGELKKVTWPGKNDLIKTTVAVLVISLFFGIYLFGVDFIFTRIFSQNTKELQRRDSPIKSRGIYGEILC